MVLFVNFKDLWGHFGIKVTYETNFEFFSKQSQ